MFTLIKGGDGIGDPDDSFNFTSSFDIYDEISILGVFLNLWIIISTDFRFQTIMILVSFFLGGIVSLRLIHRISNRSVEKSTEEQVGRIDYQ